MPPARSEIEPLVEKAGKRGQSIVAGLIRGDERAILGWTDGGVLPDEGSLFEIGSVTKALTGILLADMSLRGEVSLDDLVTRDLPPLAPTPMWAGGRVPTLEHLATHRTGLPNVPRGLGRRELAYALGLARTDPWAGVGEGDYGRAVAATAAKVRAAGRFRYSSLAFGLLGEALAARARKPYEELLRERVLTPLGMRDTSIAVPPELEARVMRGHSRLGRERAPLEDLMPAAGGVRSTGADMLALLAACLAPGEDPPGPALALAAQPRAKIAGGARIGLGWMVASGRGKPQVIWHNGGTWGFRSFAAFAPERHAAAVVLSNTTRGVDRLGFRLIDLAAR